MNKLKILIYGDYFRQKSGFAREIRDIIPFFQDAGHEVAHVALDYNGYPLERDKLIVYPTKVESVESFWASEVLLYAIENFKPDIVLTVQDYYVLYKIAFNMSHPGNHKWIHWGVADGDPLGQTSKEPCKWVNQHIFHSEFAKKVVQKEIPEIDGEVLFPSVDRKIFKEIGKKEDIKSQYKLNGRKVVLTVSRNEMRKNVPILMEAMQIVHKEIPEAVLIIAGAQATTPDKDMVASQDIERLIVDMGMEDYVILPKRNDNQPIDDEVLNIQYNLADINVLASTGEGFGLPYIEAAACRVPSIGTNCSAIPEAIGKGGLLVDPVGHMYTPDCVRQYIIKPKDLAEKIILLLKDDNLRKELGDKAFDQAKLLTPESRAKKLLEIFEETIKNDKKPIALKS